MNKLNSFLSLVIAFLVGTTCGMHIAKYDYDQMNVEPNELHELIVAISDSQADIQKQFLRFYIDDYCEGKHRAIDVNTMGSIWVGLYCDKKRVLILSDSEPFLPIATLGVDLEIDE